MLIYWRNNKKLLGRKCKEEEDEDFNMVPLSAFMVTWSWGEQEEFNTGPLSVLTQSV